MDKKKFVNIQNVFDFLGIKCDIYKNNSEYVNSDFYNELFKIDE